MEGLQSWLSGQINFRTSTMRLHRVPGEKKRMRQISARNKDSPAGQTSLGIDGGGPREREAIRNGIEGFYDY